MKNNRFRPLVELTFLTGLAFAGHMLLFQYWFSGRDANFRYSLVELYGFFFLCSAVILFLLIRMRHNNIDSVGNAFMALTVVKMVLAYVLLHPILGDTHAEVAAEKTNFFVVFLLFLTFETALAIRLLGDEKK
ncbi:hypothetical protein [Flavobacterium caeni]|uniref:Uncharacterized protein n=1 Tax=Flavobacterium caeni TaxID=490189 RepID=A0A1G5KB36_9FLAO|nr:hypothetical protein [Flavobacterium caeni]SCY97189.1 hypothetical protein SAMN02927903_03183 [Flavobacterium caeni]